MSLTEEKLDAIIKDFNEYMPIQELRNKHKITSATWAMIKNSLQLKRSRKQLINNDKVIKDYAKKKNIPLPKSPRKYKQKSKNKNIQLPDNE